MKKTALLGILALVFCCSSAMADVIDIGGPELTNSWSQQWSENGMLPDQLLPYNKIVITMNEGELEFLTVETANWAAYDNVFLYEGPEGSHIGQFDFTTTFYGYWDVPFSFNYEVFLDDELLSFQVADWDPETASWSYEYPNNCVVAMPETKFFLLLIIGLGGAVLGVALAKP